MVVTETYLSTTSVLPIPNWRWTGTGMLPLFNLQLPIGIGCIQPSSLPVQYKVYDADNRLVTTDQGPSLNGLGKIVCTGEMIDFTIERVHPEEVKITVGENALSAPFQFLLTASNEYEWQEIHVEISPGDRYVMDSIIYSLDAYSYDPENKIEKKKASPFIT